MLPGVEERSERSAEVDKVSPIVHGGPCLSGMLEKVDDLCTLSEQSKLCFFSPQHAVSSVWQVHTVVLHHITASVLALFLHFWAYFHLRLFPAISLSQVQQARSTWQKRGDWVGRDVEVEGSDEENKEEEEAVVVEEEEARREG